MNYINNLLYKEQSPHNPQPLTESSDYSMAILFGNKINNINYNTTSYVDYMMLYVPQPPKVYTSYPSEPIGYECGSGTDTHSETHSDTDNDRVVIIDIVS
jgi:hypothetical protein